MKLCLSYVSTLRADCKFIMYSDKPVSRPPFPEKENSTISFLSGRETVTQAM